MVLRSEVIPSELLRTFLIIERTGSYTDAAELLGLTQPAVSSHMKRLQQLVGGELFERGIGGLSLTRRGATVKHYATRIINLNSQMLRLCGGGEIKRSFRVGIQNVFAPTHLAKLQAHLSSRIPEHRTVITFAPGAEIQEDVTAGYLDAAFVVGGGAAASRIDERWEERVCWVCSTDFVVGEGRPVPLLSWPGSVADQLAMDAFSGSDTPHIVSLVAKDLATHVAALRAGIGVSILPQRVVPADLKVAELHFLPPLPPLKSAILVNEGLQHDEASSLRGGIAEVMPPDAPLGPEAQVRLQQAALI